MVGARVPSPTPTSLWIHEDGIGHKIDESRENISVTRIEFEFALAVNAMLVGMVIVLAAGTAGGNFCEANYSSVLVTEIWAAAKF